MAAAAELIGELGWGRVTTRAVAERAGLPHGSVSYHFRGKQDMLVSAALWAFTEVMPPESFERAGDLEGILAVNTNPELMTPALSRLMLETMREAERDPALGERVRTLIITYRQFVIDVIRAEQERGVIPENLSAEGLGILLTAVGDGLAVHLLLDPELDVAAPIRVLRTLLGRP